MYETAGPCRVYVPSISFSSVTWAALKNGHEVIIIDVDENMLFCKKDFAKKYIDDYKTSIIMPVLYGGVSNIPGIESIANEYGCLLVVDSAHCITPMVKSNYIFFSFHPVKPICMSNGGILSTNNFNAAEYFRKARNFGRRVSEDSYDIVQNGFNFYMNNLNASMGIAQLRNCDKNISKRKRNHDILVRDIGENKGRFTHHDLGSSYYLSTFILGDGLESSSVRKKLKDKGVCASYHYPPLHKTEWYRSEVELPYTDMIFNRIINLPIHQNLTEKEIYKIVKVVNDI